VVIDSLLAEVIAAERPTYDCNLMNIIIKAGGIGLSVSAAVFASALAAAGAANAATFGFTDSAQTYDVPTTGVYDITAAGGQAGGGFTGGAVIGGDVRLEAGEILTLLVGGKGSNTAYGGAGGGGGTFVSSSPAGPDDPANLLVVAGGGGGGFQSEGGLGLEGGPGNGAGGAFLANGGGGGGFSGAGAGPNGGGGYTGGIAPGGAGLGGSGADADAFGGDGGAGGAGGGGGTFSCGGYSGGGGSPAAGIEGGAGGSSYLGGLHLRWGFLQSRRELGQRVCDRQLCRPCRSRTLDVGDDADRLLGSRPRGATVPRKFERPKPRQDRRYFAHHNSEVLIRARCDVPPRRYNCRILRQQALLHSLRIFIHEKWY
jgi:hypothetical protein